MFHLAAFSLLIMSGSFTFKSQSGSVSTEVEKVSWQDAPGSH